MDRNKGGGILLEFKEVKVRQEGEVNIVIGNKWAIS
jgi:hypothetical protein